MTLYQQIKEYIPCNQQEENDRKVILNWMEHEQDLFTRNNEIAHFTASSWVTDLSHQYILMAYHNIYQSWSWLGGHSDGDEDLLHVAQKEILEESGLQEVHPLDGKIASIEILTVDGHIKRGKYVSSHLHINVTYLFEADMSQSIHKKEDENSAVAWFLKEEAVHKSVEPFFVECIYPKLNQRLEEYDQAQK